MILPENLLEERRGWVRFLVIFVINTVRTTFLSTSDTSISSLQLDHYNRLLVLFYFKGPFLIILSTDLTSTILGLLFNSLTL